MEGLAINPQFWRDRPVLVTGATGLLGSWLVKSLLDSQAQTVCLVRDWVPQSELVRSAVMERATVIRGDVRDIETVERTLGEYEIRTVFHLAAQTIVGVANRSPVSTLETNIAGTWTVLEACRRHPLVDSIVLASSDKAYGASAELPYQEDAPLAGRHPYDVSKSCADLIGQAYAHTYQLPIGIARCGNFYGGGDLNWNRIVPGTIRSILREEKPVIRSNGQFVRDYFYVEDGVLAYRLLAERLVSDPAFHGQAFNFSGETPVTVVELVARLLKLMDSTAHPEIRNEAVNEIPNQRLSTDRARRLLGWEPKFPLELGLKLTIDWYRNFFGSAANEFSDREFAATNSRTGC